MAQAAASLSSETLASLAAKSMSVGTAPSTNCGVQHQPSPTLANTQTLLDVQRQLRNAYEDQKKEEEQRQLRAAFEEERRKEKAKNKAEMITAAARKLTLDAIDSSPMMPGGTDSGKAKAQDASPTELLQKSYEAHLQMLMTKDNIREVQSLSGSNRASTGTVDEDIIRERLSTEPKTSTIQTNINEVNESEQPMPDEEAGTVLLGFLNSLRQSYEDAVERKSGDANVERPLRENENDRLTTPPESIHKDAELSSVIRDVRSETKRRGTKRSPNRNSDLRSPQDGDARYLSTAVSQFISNKGGRRSQRPASVTDISSGNSSFQQGEFSSSLEDSSDKTDPSSSEESDKEDPSQIRWQSKGPPRKRVKSFTVENLLAHSKRMSENSGEHKHFER